MDKYKCFFGMIPELGVSAMTKLNEVFGSEEGVYKTDVAKIERADILTKNQLGALNSAKNNASPEKFVEDIISKQIKAVFWGDEIYPEKLKEIPNPPYQLFYLGKLPATKEKCVSIIGARNCSEYGKEAANYFGSELAKKGVSVVSGLASGIDCISQKASVDNGGISYGIVGSGVDICYPASNRSIYENLKSAGGVISEFPPGTKPLARNFPLRNRIISGLSDVVLVVEARERSGTSITVNMALEQGRSVYAVPGRINNALSKGCNRMISEGAGVATSVDVILDELGIVNYYKDIVVKCIQNGVDNPLKNSIIQLLMDKEYDINELYSNLDGATDIGDLQVLLMEMCLEGVIYERLSVYGVIKSFKREG